MDPTLPSNAGLPSNPGGPVRRGPRTGREIAGKYRLGDLLGKGGRGEVYAALQIDLAREVAVKLLTEAGRDDDARARFLRETRIAADLRHPCIVQIYDAGIDTDGAPYCVMERLEGETLEERLAREGPLGAPEAVALAAGLCLALQAVHQKGFLHRDVKPSNVFLARRPDGGADPKLIDFGIAKRLPMSAETRRRITTLRGMGAPKATALDVIVGTPRYLSPEQILGGELSARTDVYALATTLYEMLAGEPPFTAGNVTDLLARVAVEVPEPLRRRAPSRSVPAPLDQVILRALSKDPDRRPASAADFATALWAALAEDKLAATSSVAPPPRAHPRRLALVVVAGVAVIAASAFLASGGRRGAEARPAAPLTPPSAPAPQPTALPSATVARAEAPPAASAPASDRAPLRVAPPAPGRRRGDLKSPY